MPDLCQKIELTTWPRAENFRFFSSLDQPFYSVCFRVDVTKLHAYAKSHNLSFYHAMIYFVTQAVNETENFRYTIRDGEVYLLPVLDDSATVKRFHKDGSTVWLMPENPAYDPIDGTQAQILGKVKAVIRTY